MNSRPPLFLALVLSIGLSAFANSGRCGPPLSGPPPNLSIPALEFQSIEFQSIHMIDRENGWAENARAVLITNHWIYNNKAILRTTNGGKSWKYVLFADRDDDFMAACFYNARTAWALPTFDGATNVVVFHTRNGGRSWSSVTFKPPSVLLSAFLSFPDTHRGRLMLIPDHGMNSSPGYLYRTEDGGKRWQEVNSVGGPYWDPEGTQSGFADQHPYLVCGGSIAFRNASVGWVLDSLTSTTRNFLFITRDGGKHWRLQTLPLPKGIHAGRIEPMALPQFFPTDRRDGILPVQFVPKADRATHAATIIYDSHDGGLSWQPTTPVPFARVCSFMNAKQGWIWSPRPQNSNATAAAKGVLHHTDDGGRSWKSVHPIKGLGEYLTHGQNIVQMDFVDAKSGWAIARDGNNFTQLLHTADGGRTWNSIQAKIEQ